ncbi:hypothetical protein BD780_003977 [Clostridium tetanomorphum]|uniref:DUF3870 domain-containing protein n=1 Tax=Clostridium tetanomorphum TaxID=1553 RepID=A0A923ECH1_CLOTT|nr:DUF3870 domain-containing protein [Clostridium tetanomorphum]KAJ49865.1 hypothetical protein CTM_20941 [Clostridium tetanomorphum DSM 665]MBC2399319.1 DUF3870 domain-containing protein [Clostridium tetanomorphum]MBP1866124.1 hypothetical protein [Clostridium tetanomorphum]NRS86752.1 hypothetical protein [Clostridium tetanomorphum]NRZ99495.1 hypothetical protein [Clostridium tetanomorphum]
MNYSKSTIYITGISRSNSTDPITIMYNSFFLGVIVDKKEGIIIDITCNTISNVTTDFIKSMLVGYNLLQDLGKMIDEIHNRFFGTAQKALIVALKDAHNKFTIEKKKQEKGAVK